MSAVDPPADDVVAALRRAGLTVATAESLTGGLVAAALTSVPGSSAVVRGGLIVYATDLKHRLAGVDADLLDLVGPVHPEVAAALAVGAARVCSADLGVGLTGVAGPDPQDGVPVGTVYCSLARGDRAVRASADLVAGDRGAVRDAAVRRALELLLDEALAAPDSSSA